MAEKVWIRQLFFNDESRINFESNDIVVLVGPNNSGKSTVLREINNLAADLNWLANARILRGLAFGKEGSEHGFLSRIEETSARIHLNGSQKRYEGYRGTIDDTTILLCWREMSSLGLRSIHQYVISLITADGRLNIAQSVDSYDLLTGYPTHPVHFLFNSEETELRFSEAFKRAFNTDLVVNRAAGRTIHLHVGKRPKLAPGEHDRSTKYLDELRDLPRIEEQGDGIRSFCGLLLQTFFDNEFINLVDEPEVFLHPPQARLLGRMIAKDTPKEKQIFIATHSEDFLKGLLDSKSNRVKVLRINRKDSINPVIELTKEEIESTWSDPLLKHSNVLSGLFHTRVVLCEADADCKFYSAILDNLVDQDHENKEADKKFTELIDPLFIHCGGKQRMHVVIKSLRKLNVPIAVIPDFDVLNNKDTLKTIWEALGGQWTEIEKDWNIIRTAIEQSKTELIANEVKTRITAVMEGVNDRIFPEAKVADIRDILKRSSPWSIVKEAGRSALPAGEATSAFDRLIPVLNAKGLFVVEVGILESFVKSVGNHGPKWVNDVLQKDIQTEAEFESVKAFIIKIFGKK
jgi:energy-coupling factor transporter ATP-binding protein EcfA2